MDLTSFMAAFALAAFWLNTVLIAAAGWSEAAALLRARASHLAPGTGARRGVVTAAAGPDGALAVWRVVQVGRSNGAGPILFHDRSQHAEVFGGTVALADGSSVELAPGTAAEPWIGGAARQRAAACPDPAAFAAASPAATRAAGWERRLELPLRVGETIWLAGQVDAGLVLADADPRAWRTRVKLRTVALVLGLLVVAGACTIACLWPPVFGTVSKLGAAAALVAFNLFQLFGKLHHDAIQPPPATVIAGAWRRP
jgi:hypothetical protein